MDLTLGQKQRLFAKLIGVLIGEIYSKGYELSFGEVARSDEQATINAMGFNGRSSLVDYLEKDLRFHGLALAIFNNGKANGILMSNHRLSLAVDLNLFKDGVYLTSSSDHEPFGIYWEGLHPLCRWGGRFGDGNHYSFEHDGRK